MIIINWLVRSSRDPARLALTVRAGLPFLLLVAGWAGLGGAINEEIGNDLIELIVGLVVLLGQFAAGGFALFGLGRKIYLSVK